MGDSSTYIHMVHRLIEECIIFNMTKEECMEALSKHANINPIITSTVWKELEKENKDFFETYKDNRAGAARESKSERKQRIQEMLSGHLSQTASDTDETSCTTTQSDD